MTVEQQKQSDLKRDAKNVSKNLSFQMSSINASNLDSGRGSIGGSGGQSGSGIPTTSDSEAETRKPSKRVKKTSPTLDTIVSFKYSLSQFITSYAILAYVIWKNSY